MVLVSTTIDSGREPFEQSFITLEDRPERIGVRDHRDDDVALLGERLRRLGDGRPDRRQGLAALVGAIPDGEREPRLRHSAGHRRPHPAQTYEPNGQVSRLGHVVVFSRSFDSSRDTR